LILHSICLDMCFGVKYVTNVTLLYVSN
jgi:hypothetical protein